MRRKRLGFLVIFIGCFFALFLFKAGYEQIANYRKNNQLWKKRLVRVVKVRGKRGKIFDAKGKVLAFNIPSYSVFADPLIFSADEENLSLLSRALGTDRKKLLSKLRSNKRFVWLKRNVTDETLKKLRTLNIRGVGVVEGYRRFYPEGSVASHIIGFCDVDNEGLEGIERKYNSYLRPECLHVKALMGMGGILSRKDDFYNTMDGADVFLTIDENVQSFVRQTLRRAVEENRAKKAICIVMRPEGAITACSIYPDFDLNLYGAYPYSIKRNSAFLDVWEPGSIFKIVTLGAAIDTDKAKRKKSYVCGSMKMGKYTIHDVHRYDKLSFDDVFVKSSNVGAAKVMFELGKEKFHDYITRFGFGRKTGIDFPGEAKGLVRDITSCSDLNLANMAFGQGIGVTAIQLCSAFCTIANGGFKIKPYLVEKVISPEGTVLYEAHRKKERILKPDTVKIVKEILEKVVEEGTGERARIPGFRVAGKTGTAQIPGKGGYRRKVISSFAGFFPVENPQFVILVSFFEPEVKPGYGGVIAAPVFRTIARMLIGYEGISRE